MDRLRNMPENDRNALTSIRDAYTLAATDEADSLMVKHFLDILAEVSLSIATRQQEKEE